MTKFFLVMWICSTVSKQCLPMVTDMDYFKTYQECAIYGYQYSANFMQELKPDEVDTERLIIQFNCREEKTI